MHARNPVTVTMHMWAPNKLLCVALWRQMHTTSTKERMSAYKHTQDKEKNTHENTCSRRKGTLPQFSCVPTNHTPTSSIRRSLRQNNLRQYSIFCHLFHLYNKAKTNQLLSFKQNGENFHDYESYETENQIFSGFGLCNNFLTSH